MLILLGLVAKFHPVISPSCYRGYIKALEQPHLPEGFHTPRRIDSKNHSRQVLGTKCVIVPPKHCYARSHHRDVKPSWSSVETVGLGSQFEAAAKISRIPEDFWPRAHFMMCRPSFMLVSLFREMRFPTGNYRKAVLQFRPL